MTIGSGIAHAGRRMIKKKKEGKKKRKGQSRRGSALVRRDTFLDMQIGW